MKTRKLFPLVAATLTPVELDVAEWLLCGLDSTQIAKIRGVSVRSVKHSLKAMYLKFGLFQTIDKLQKIQLAMILYGWSEPR